jgi:predicted MPP superfamily phosphohydrolase
MFGYMPEPMANLVRTIVRFVSDTPVVIPLLMFPVAVWVCYQAWARVGVPSIARWIAATTFFFGASDGLLMAALPHLGLSFGPVGLPWLGVSLARALLAWGVAVTCRVRRELVVSAILLGILNLAILACEVYGLYIEPFNVSVTHQRITLFSQSDPVQLRIVQLSDLHVERVTQRERTVLKMVEQSKPDLILLTGDYLNTSYVNDETARRDARDWLSQLRAPRGVYAVPGSPSVDTRDAIESLFDDMDNITLLRNQIVQLDVDGQTICLIGVTNQWQERDRASLKALMKQVPSDALTILLYHTPDLIETAANLDVDVYLAGHTHGGPVRLPWFGAIVTSSRYGKRYEAGPYQVGTTHLYVNRGIGMEGSGALRVRWLCPPEVAEMEISVVEKAP